LKVNIKLEFIYDRSLTFVEYGVKFTKNNTWNTECAVVFVTLIF